MKTMKIAVRTSANTKDTWEKLQRAAENNN